MDASALEYERVMEKKKQLLIKIQETKTGIRNKQNQLKILEEGLQKIKDQEGKESVGGKLNIFLRDFSVILEAMRTEKAFMETKYATQSFRNRHIRVYGLLQTVRFYTYGGK